jgi:hypothetical protein
VPRKPFLIRLDPAVLTAIEAWAADDLRSINGQIEFVLREALRKAGRKVKSSDDAAPETATPEVPASEAAEAPPAARRRRSG